MVDIFHFSLQVKLALFSLVVDNMAQSHLKFTPPRALTNEETQLTMTRWKINFKQYMKRDPSYITFLNMEWVPTAENYKLQKETEGLKRSPEALKDDLLDFLHILCSYLPHGYLTDRIISKSTSLLSAFKIIDESFNLLPNQESFFEFKGLKKMSSETYRQMFDRMVAFSSQHLMPARTPQVDVDGVLVPDGGDALTVSHLNLIALLWLDKLSPDLLNIVRTEYAKELRDNEPLAGLVPRISQNVNHLLLKYEKPPLPMVPQLTSFMNKFRSKQTPRKSIDSVVEVEAADKLPVVVEVSATTAEVDTTEAEGFAPGASTCLSSSPPTSASVTTPRSARGRLPPSCCWRPRTPPSSPWSLLTTMLQVSPQLTQLTPVVMIFNRER